MKRVTEHKDFPHYHSLQYMSQTKEGDAEAADIGNEEMAAADSKPEANEKSDKSDKPSAEKDTAAEGDDEEAKEPASKR